MIPLRSTFPRLSISPRRATACRARSWVHLSPEPFRGLRCLCSLGLSLPRHHFHVLEGAPPLVCKGGLLRPNATVPALPHLGFLFYESRFTNHESHSSPAEAQS